MDEQPAWAPQTPAPPQGAPPPPPVRRGVVGAVVALVVVLATTAVLLVGGRNGDEAIPATTVGADDDRIGGLELPDVPDGYQLFRGPDSSFALVVPSGWETVLLEEDAVRRATDRLGAEHPETAAALLQAAQTVGDRGKAFAAEVDDDDGFVANLNLLQVPRPSGSLASLLDADRATLEQMGFAIGQPEPVAVGGLSALLVPMRMDLPTGPVASQQLYLASGYRAYVLTVSGMDDRTARTVLRSLRVP
jgi:hypothetical protein